MATVTIKPVGYAIATYFTERRDEFERDGTVIYHAPMGMATAPLFTSEALAQARAEGKAEGMRDWQQMEKAAQDVLAERERQKTAEGWTSDHDDSHTKGEMAAAAGIYALVASSSDRRWIVKGLSGNDYIAAAMKLWPWDKPWFKPTDPRRDLVKAGALLLAEIERIDRLALPSTPADGETTTNA